MSRSHEDDPLLVSARREAIATLIIWASALTYTVGYYATHAFPKPDADGKLPMPELIWGIPAWVVWGVLAPWTACTVITLVMTNVFMTDGDLGPDADEGMDDAEKLLRGVSDE
jgi:hypothetical protein